jgi:hypothetical protein
MRQRDLDLGIYPDLVINAKLVVVPGQLCNLSQVHCGSTPQPPISGTKPADQRHIDRLVIMITQRVLEQDHNGVNNVFFVDPDNLHLLQQHLSEQNSKRVYIQTSHPLDLVAKIQLIKEYVNVEITCRVMKNHALACKVQIDLGRVSKHAIGPYPVG